MKVENTASAPIPFFGMGVRDADDRPVPSAIADQLVTAAISPRHPSRSIQRSHRQASARPQWVIPQAPPTLAPRQAHILGPTLGVDFSAHLRWLQAQPRYISAIALMVEKLVDFANNRPRNWNFDLHSQAESAMVNFYLGHLHPRLRERYDSKIDVIHHISAHVASFSRLFFLASMTPLSKDRLDAYARRWMEVETKKSVPYVKVYLRTLMGSPIQHLAIPHDAHRALTQELATVCGIHGTEKYDAALFCVSAFIQMVKHLAADSILHEKLLKPMHMPEHGLIRADNDFDFATRLCNSGIPPDYVVNVMTGNALKLLEALRPGDAPPPPRPSAPRLRSRHR